MASMTKDSLQLRTVCNELSPVEPKAFKIGIQLGVPLNILQMLKTEEILPAMIDYWLKGNVEDVPVSWESLVKALDSAQVGEPALAKTIATKYCQSDSNNTLPFQSEEELKQIQLCHSLGKIMEQYDSYLRCIHKSLEARSVTTEKLNAYLLQLPAIKIGYANQQPLLAGFKMELLKAESVKEIIDFLKNNFASFWDYDIFVSIVHQFGIGENRDSGKTEILKYPEHFMAYAKRQKLSDIIGVVPNFDNHESNSEKITIKFEIDMSEYSLANLMELKSKIANVLNLHESTLKLLNVEEGCIVVTFLFSLALIHFVFPSGEALTMQQMNELRDLSALQFECCGKKFVLRHRDSNSKNMSDELELYSFLSDYGLKNTEFWVLELKILGICSKDSLISHEGNMSVLLQLEEKAQSATEKQILRKILKLNISKYLSAFLQRDILNFETFDKFFNAILEIAKTSTCDIDYSPHLRKGMNLLKSHYHQTYDAVFFDIIMQLFQTKSLVLLKDLEVLHIILLEERRNFVAYRKKHHKQLQAYLLHLVICVNQDSQDISTKKIVGQIKNCLLQIVHLSLNQDILTLLDRYFFCSFSTREFKHRMECFMMGAPQNLLPILPGVQACNSPSHLFDVLGLTNFYPQQLCIQDAICIRSEILKLSLEKTCGEIKQLPLLILHKLMSYDTMCRSDLGVGYEISEKHDVDGGSSSHESDYAIHPVDGLLAVILCSDDFLRQDMFSRLAKCQLAVPFLLPDPFTKQLTLPLWALRAISKEWKSTTETGAIIQQEQSIVSYKMPFISFIRFGAHQKRGASKSKILNEVISDSHYDHFFHRDCPGGQYNCILGEGLVDMCWYLPAGKSNDVFPDAVTFLNLHGDARQHPEQCKFLNKISFMCFILLTEEILELDSQAVEILNQFASAPGGVVLLNDVDQPPKAMKKEISNVYVINLTTKTGAEIKHAIPQQIRSKLSQATELEDIEYWCGKREQTILCDEDSEYYKIAFTQAMEISSMITSHEAKSSIKEVMLPLQGTKLKQSWATLDKEFYRQIMRGKKTVSDYTDNICSEKKDIRRIQLNHIKSLSPVMKSFIDSLLRFGGSFNQSIRNYFLQCLKLQLSNLSRKNILSSLQCEYQSALFDLHTACDSQEGISKAKTTEIEELTKLIEELQEAITNSFFSLEHFVRELGQVYEAAILSSELREKLSCLPRAAAELLIDGYPLELMDGDTAHLPLQWVSAVLTEAIEILEDPNVFVLSVVGLQSTGKSTMLNTVFGVQFNADAGRHTRGAFMQLVPLDEKLKEQTTCSYLLVIDTEGLHAPELDLEKAQNYGNELVTFVTGLANMTLINIHGEVSREMDDILHTCVHAFISMSQVYKHCNHSCQFIYQNAGAYVNSEVGRAKFTEKLDKFTFDVAKQEECERQYKCFSDVMKFNDQTDMRCFPVLWKGDPPMAPVNEGYSKASQMLKQHFINIMCKKSVLLTEEVHSNLSLFTFKKKVVHVWNNILKENLAFSFKNTLEKNVYNSLKMAFSNWTWRFRDAMLNWERRAENEIRTANANDVPCLVKEKCEKLQVYSHMPPTFVMKELGKHCEILVQWKARVKERLDDLAMELKLHAERLCYELRKSGETMTSSGFENDKIQYAKLVTDRVQRHIKQEQEEFDKSLKEKKLKSEQLKKIFERDLFSSKNLMLYKNMNLLSERQASKISHLTLYNGQLTIRGLREVLENEIISTEEMKNILKTTRQTEEELEDHFKAIWEEMLSQLPVLLSEFETVEDIVVAVLIKFIVAKGYEGQIVVNKLGQTKLREWGKQLVLFPKEGKHFVMDHLLRCHRYIKSEMTERVFNSASKYLEELERVNFGFNPDFALELLHHVDQKNTEEAATVEEYIKFTFDYKLEIFLTVCGYAVPTFKRMADSFKKQNDPLVYLQQHVRDPLLTLYTNQYNQLEAEESIAVSLCKFLQAPLQEQIRRNLGAKVVGQMKNSVQFFADKVALKMKILADIHNEGEFRSYMCYVENVKQCLQDHIRCYAIDYCDQDLHGETRLQLAAKEEASRLIKVVDIVVTRLKETTVEKWLLTLGKDLQFRRETGVSIDSDNIILTWYDSLHELNLKKFQSKMKIELQKLEAKLHSFFNDIQCEREMIHWKDKPRDLLESLVGCTEQCPFCNEQCDLGKQHAGKHRTKAHRPACLAGWKHSATKVMLTDCCQPLIHSNRNFLNPNDEDKPYPYRKYNSVFPHWSIPPDHSSYECSLYWKSFVGEFNCQLADHYDARPAEVSKWKGMSWHDIKLDLERIYNCYESELPNFVICTRIHSNEEINS